ncbi:MAG: histidine phosphatase family protein [Chlamydiae bacterium]|nr:histidine phosphatase family protein [Chlamydiota bacterium]
MQSSLFPKENTKKIYLIRHGETLWTLAGRHTGLTDIPLTENGKKQAAKLKSALQSIPFDLVLTSPLQRARETSNLVGLTKQAEVYDDLREWNYGKYEGLTSEEIAKIDPKWSLFSQGAPSGESLHDILQRADRIIEKVLEASGNVAIFSSGHISRALIARWLHLPVQEGRFFYISPASISILGFEHNGPVILGLNHLCHLS